jgi:hypothetical protein
LVRIHPTAAQRAGIGNNIRRRKSAGAGPADCFVKARRKTSFVLAFFLDVKLDVKNDIQLKVKVVECMVVQMP